MRIIATTFRPARVILKPILVLCPIKTIRQSRQVDTPSPKAPESSLYHTIIVKNFDYIILC